MRKMTISDLQGKLYLETLREEYKNRDFMFTTIGEKMSFHIAHSIEMDIKELEQKQAFSDEEISNLHEAKYFSVDQIRKNLVRHKDELKEHLAECQMDCKNEDFALAILLSCWKNKFETKSPNDAELVNSYLVHELNLDADKVTPCNVVEYYSDYISSKPRFIQEEEVFNLISSYGNEEDILEIDTDFFGKSTKMLSKNGRFVISKVLRDLTLGNFEVVRYEETLNSLPKEDYSTIISLVSSCKDQTVDGIVSFFNQLVGQADKNSGRIILIDTDHVLISDEMYKFREKMIEDSLLEIYISGRNLYADVYILRSYSSSETVLFNFVCGHQNSFSFKDNFLTLHNKLLKSDIRSIDYNFEATSDLLTGQQGKAYTFNEIFSVPTTGVEEKKVSGVYPILQMKDMPRDFTHSLKCSGDFDKCEISGLFKVITENKIAVFVGDDKIQFCFIEATPEAPVYVGLQFAILDINIDILTPKYVQVLCAKGIFEKAIESDTPDRSYFRYTDCGFDSYEGREFFVTPEDKIVNIHTMIQIPSKEQQYKEIEDVQFINASSINREKALEMLIEEKTWLNEEHIRNIKHRIGNGLTPIKNDIDAISKLMQNHPEGIKLDTVRGKNEKVSEILERLSRDIIIVNECLQDLTRTIDKGDLKPVDIIEVANAFVDTIETQKFELLSNIPKEHIYVNGSSNMINSILRNIVDNAKRHGFIDENRNDYAVNITISKDGNGNCVIEIKNNGIPMNEHAHNNYFKRGGVAGKTGHSGIGGADVKDSVNAMGGEVTLLETENEWTVCVRISLPILNEEKI